MPIGGGSLLQRPQFGGKLLLAGPALGGRLRHLSLEAFDIGGIAGELGEAIAALRFEAGDFRGEDLDPPAARERAPPRDP